MTENYRTQYTVQTTDDRRQITRSIFLACWMIAGGTIVARSEYMVILYMLAASVLMIQVIRRVKEIPNLRSLALVGAALLLSLANNPGLYLEAHLSLVTCIAAFGMLAVGTEDDQPGETVYRALWIWLAGWVLMTLLQVGESRNIAAIWAALGILLALALKKPWFHLIPYIGALAYADSRGAVLGLAAGLAYLFRARIKPDQRYTVFLVGLALVGGLFVLRPQTAFNRFSYWQQALAAIEGDLWFGLGPTGIEQGQVIREPGDLDHYQPHAHNIFIQVLTELGIVGLVLVGLAAFLALRSVVWEGWWAAALLGLGVHSLVDFPLAWVGVVMVFAYLFGGMPKKSRVLVTDTSSPGEPVVTMMEKK